MTHELTDDADLRESFTGSVRHGQFATYEEAERDFWAKLDEAVAEADRGEFIDSGVVRASLRERFRNWPRAAE